MEYKKSWEVQVNSGRKENKIVLSFSLSYFSLFLYISLSLPLLLSSYFSFSPSQGILLLLLAPWVENVSSPFPEFCKSHESALCIVNFFVYSSTSFSVLLSLLSLFCTFYACLSISLFFFSISQFVPFLISFFRFDIKAILVVVKLFIYLDIWS